MLDIDDLLISESSTSVSKEAKSRSSAETSWRSSRPSSAHRHSANRAQRFRSAVLLVVGVVAAIVAAQVWNANSTRTSIIVAAQDLAPGDVIAQADIKLIEADRFSTMFEDRSLVVGQRVRFPVLADEPILSSDLGAGIELPEGLVVAGVLIAPGAYPAVDLVPGDRVEISGVNPVTGVVELIAGDVQIFSVSRSGFGTDELFVSVAVSPAQSLRIANAVNQAEGVRIALRAQSGS